MKPLIFTHYGNSDYLHFTLRQARLSNPNSDCYLIGDHTNCTTALQNGWVHINQKSLINAKRDLFNARFFWVQGPLHNPVKGNQDWLRYVFERFFMIEVFCLEQGIETFWHFDSDTMIVTSLEPFENNFKELAYEATALSPKLSCLSGLVSINLLSKYTTSIIDDFCDDAYIEKNMKEFMNKPSLYFALTEMRAFRNLIVKESPHIGHASDLGYPDGYYFDDCICQPQGLDFKYSLPDLKKTKNIFTEYGQFFCRQSNSTKVMRAATINCSWMSMGIYHWIHKNSFHESSRPRYLRHRLRDSRLLDMLRGN